MQRISSRFKYAGLFSSVFLSLSVAGVANPSSLLGPRISGNTAGQVVAIWSEFDEGCFVVKQAELPFGGSWGDGLQVSPTGQNCMYPDIDINAGGKILSGWKNADDNEGASMQVCFDNFGTDEEPTLATTSFYAGPPVSGYFPDIELSNGGKGVLLWQGSGSSGYMLLATGCSEEDLRTPIVYLSSGTSYMPDPDFVMNLETGTGLALWIATVGSNKAVVAGSVSLAGVRTGPVLLSTEGTNAGSPTVVFNSAGDAFGAWVIKTQPYFALEATSLSDTLVASPTTLSMSGASLMHPRIAANAAGQVLLVAEAQTGITASQIVTALQGATSGWGPFQTLSASATLQAKAPEVALNESGQGVAIWVDRTSGQGVIQVAQYSSGEWGDPIPLSSTQYNSGVPMVYLHDSGYAVVSWLSLDTQSTETNTFLIQSACLPSMTGTWGSAQTLSP